MKLEGIGKKYSAREADNQNILLRNNSLVCIPPIRREIIYILVNISLRLSLACSCCMCVLTPVTVKRGEQIQWRRHLCVVCVCVSCVFYLVHRTNARCVAFSKVLIQQCHTRVTHLRYVCSTLQ